MFTARTLSAAACAALALVAAGGASAQTTPPAPDPSAAMPGMSAPAPASLSDGDKVFMLRSAQGDMAEISTSQMALKQAKFPGVKEAAQRLIHDHSQSLKEGMGLAVLLGLPAPKGPAIADQDVAQKLMGLKGADFDKHYMAAQEADHENTIALFNMEITQGQNPQVKAFAAKYLPGIESHTIELYQVAKLVGAPFSELRPAMPPTVAGYPPSSAPPKPVSADAMSTAPAPAAMPMPAAGQ